MPQFPEEIIIQAFYRQKGICGLCGKKLVYENYEKGDKGAWHAHHLDGTNTNHKLSNCVCLCINKPENCHLEAHFRDYSGDYVLPKTSFVFFNGS
jgi:hypothetical protein